MSARVCLSLTAGVALLSCGHPTPSPAAAHEEWTSLLVEALSEKCELAETDVGASDLGKHALTRFDSAEWRIATESAWTVLGCDARQVFTKYPFWGRRFLKDRPGIQWSVPGTESDHDHALFFGRGLAILTTFERVSAESWIVRAYTYDTSDR